ncbi:monocarboxylate transporter [Bimuria novae-zelandiae CBS 107.79]|uniref:Monocarboxylate transporter n=1 Tax=Bimuria novae-zelandiae CBS 107.79 TaxID=1447943 RepID=A0A6A5VMD9_9PLEO|nr:monocarboxylate transporter [Bimuria novae-zelandiae CBS 107.79]
MAFRLAFVFSRSLLIKLFKGLKHFWDLARRAGGVPAVPPPPPDGGLRAWMQCLAGFGIFFNTWGLLNSFGVFQAFYERDFLSSSNSSQISWIGTVQSSFIMLGSVYSGPLYNWGYLKALILIGSFLLVFGMFMTSLCDKYWQTLLDQGLLMGLGTGCLFTPTTGVVASYFAKRRGLAMGIVSTGSTIGGIIYPVMFHKLAQTVGFGWATRAIAFIMLALTALPITAMEMRLKPPTIRRVFDISAWKEPHYYTFYAMALFVGYMGMYIPFFYIQVYCLENSIMTEDLGFYLLPIMNASGFFGRLALGHLADRIGPLNAFILSSGACGVLVFGWIGIESEATIMMFCLLYGFFSSGLITLPATVVTVNLCPDIRQYGVRLTMQLVPSAIGLLIGNPIAGAILKDGWLGLQVFAAATIIGCTALSIASRVAKAVELLDAM